MDVPLSVSQPLSFLPGWIAWAERGWHECDPHHGYYCADPGSKAASFATAGYLAACALAATGRAEAGSLSRDEAAHRAEQALRFLLATHRPETVPVPDAAVWGHHWGSGITLERVANFVDLCDSFASPELLEAWRLMLADEADYQLGVEILTNRFSENGETHGERNYWRGAMLFRAARMLPQHPHAADWLEKAATFLVNSMSLPEDAHDNTIVDGKPVRERHVGANAHAGCLFEHHGVLSLDYSVITASFFTMSMIGLLRNGWEPLDSLFHHQEDLWRVIRHFITDDGRIICIGKQRPRYTIMYCYLLPTLALRAKFLGDQEAPALLENGIGILNKDRAASADGAFFSDRGEGVRRQWQNNRPNYYYRLDADAVLSLGMIALLNETPRRPLTPGPTAGAHAVEPASQPDALFSRDAQFVSRRTAHGFFCVNWKRLPTAEAAPALALCVPSANGHRTDCLGNLETRFHPFLPVHGPGHWSAWEYDQGFVTAAVSCEGKPFPHEDAYISGMEQHILFALLPDGRSFLRYEKAIARRDVRVDRVESLNVNLARDIFTHNQYVLATSDGMRTVGAEAGDGRIAIPGRWLNVSGELAVLHLHGPEGMAVRTFARRQRGYATLRVDQIEYVVTPGKHLFHPGEVILESAFLLVANLPADETPGFAEGTSFRVRPRGCADLDLLEVVLPTGVRMGLAVDFSGAVRRSEESLPSSLEGMRRASLTPLWNDTNCPYVSMYGSVR